MKKTLPTLMVEVVIRSLDDPEKVERQQRDFNNHGARVWISKTQLWAMNNRHSVNLSPVTADD